MGLLCASVRCAAKPRWGVAMMQFKAEKALGNAKEAVEDAVDEA